MTSHCLEEKFFSDIAIEIAGLSQQVLWVTALIDSPELIMYMLLNIIYNCTS